MADKLDGKARDLLLGKVIALFGTRAPPSYMLFIAMQLPSSGYERV